VEEEEENFVATDLQMKSDNAEQKNIATSILSVFVV
jgi:hypothetical protein